MVTSQVLRGHFFVYSKEKREENGDIMSAKSS